ncbi:integrase core domain-containing protein [Corynebacterium sp. YSMAA1_1_D6]|uniref:integrase core domain-containing protein n=2 Tax=unclassified Corynebacterium TaxID=2624378 RepID=UPI0038CFDB2F
MAISTHLRKKIADFDPVRDGRTVTQFCKDIGVSRQTYANIKRRVEQRGRAGILPDSTAPHSPARIYDDHLRQKVITARSVLKAQGRDYGPWSIYYYLIDDLGLEHPPARSTIALWLHEAGVAEANARKRPRKSYKRWARDKVDELWQLDGFVYRLFDTPHTQITIYQLVDDASRFDLGSQAFAAKENGFDARTTLAAAIETYGRPQELLTDNGEAFATYHRGRLSDTERWLAAQGIWSIAGFGPQTQGKDERSHQTMTKFLDARQPTTLQHVQQLLDDYREFYNTRRRHQGLLVGKMHITPAQAREHFAHAQSPTQPIDPDLLWAKIVKSYRDTHSESAIHHEHRIENGVKEAMAPVVGEVAASPTTIDDDNEPIQQESSPTVSPTVDGLSAQSSNAWGIPDTLWINKSGVVRILGYGFYVGLRFKNRLIYSHVTDDTAEFFTDHDGEALFSFPLPIKLLERPAGGQINIGHVEGMWHRRPPEIKPILSRPRPSRRKKP